LHGKVGAAIEQHHYERLDEFVGELAFHYGESGDDPKARYWLPAPATGRQRCTPTTTH
jgi:hypothetical protein